MKHNLILLNNEAKRILNYSDDTWILVSFVSNTIGGKIMGGVIYKNIGEKSRPPSICNTYDLILITSTKEIAIGSNDEYIDDLETSYVRIGTLFIDDDGNRLNPTTTLKIRSAIDLYTDRVGARLIGEILLRNKYRVAIGSDMLSKYIKDRNLYCVQLCNDGVGTNSAYELWETIIKTCNSCTPIETKQILCAIGYPVPKYTLSMKPMLHFIENNYIKAQQFKRAMICGYTPNDSRGTSFINNNFSDDMCANIAEFIRQIRHISQQSDEIVVEGNQISNCIINAIINFVLTNPIVPDICKCYISDMIDTYRDCKTKEYKIRVSDLIDYMAETSVLPINYNKYSLDILNLSVYYILDAFLGVIECMGTEVTIKDSKLNNIFERLEAYICKPIKCPSDKFYSVVSHIKNMSHRQYCAYFNDILSYVNPSIDVNASSIRRKLTYINDTALGYTQILLIKLFSDLSHTIKVND